MLCLPLHAQPRRLLRRGVRTQAVHSTPARLALRAMLAADPSPPGEREDRGFK